MVRVVIVTKAIGDDVRILVHPGTVHVEVFFNLESCCNNNNNNNNTMIITTTSIILRS